MSYFSGKDLELIEALVYQPDLEPGYDVMRDALVWSDEWSYYLSSEGFEKMCKLRIARSFIHREIPFSSYPGDSDALQKAWFEAREQVPNWPGFKRLKLSQKDKDFYKEQSENDGFLV